MNFKEIKIEFKAAFKEVLSGDYIVEMNEAAFPAYAHKNPLIDFLFWERLITCYGFMKNGSNAKVLDFGCGSGVFSYILAHNGFEVTANDLNLRPQRLIGNIIKFPDGIKFIEGDILRNSLEDSSFDYIIALDSLEHIADITEYIQLFKRLLKPDGIIIVSGPTENIFYRIGRRFAGNDFSGEFHVSDIKKIKRHFSYYFKINASKKLFYPFVFFEVFTAKNGQTSVN